MEYQRIHSQHSFFFFFFPNILLLEGNAFGGPGRFVSLATILVSLPARALLWAVLLDRQSS